MADLALWQVLLAGGFVAAAGGLLGSFALLRRMALVGDVLSHVALPGIAVPFRGTLVPAAFVAVFVTTIGVALLLPPPVVSV